jgi:hypothetical protein
MIPKWFPTGKAIQYQKIDHESTLLSEETTENSRQWIANLDGKFCLSIVIYAILLTGVCTAAIIALALPLTITAPTSQLITECGSSHIEARERNCRFDPMSFSWLPPACFDEELVHEFEQYQEWHWYKNKRGTVEVSKEEVYMGDAPYVFVAMDYHRAHCTFMWKKLHRALAKGHLVDTYVGNYTHTKHCEHMLLDKKTMADDVNTLIFVKFPHCNSHQVFM